jgi:hypothetical protein
MWVGGGVGVDLDQRSAEWFGWGWFGMGRDVQCGAEG